MDIKTSFYCHLTGDKHLIKYTLSGVSSLNFEQYDRKVFWEEKRFLFSQIITHYYYTVCKDRPLNLVGRNRLNTDK